MNRDLIFYDFETSSICPHTCQPTQLAALAIDPRNFKVKGEFNSEIWAETDDEKAVAAGLGVIQEGALKVTGKTREKIALAPPLKIVWEKFVNFVNKYNWKSSSFTAPIPCGHNIINYDSVIIERMCKLYGPWDKKNNKGGLFSPIFKMDLMDISFAWLEGDPNVKSYSMDSLRQKLGMSKDNAHDALQDVKDTANIMIKFMKTHRAVYKNLKLENSFAGGDLFIL